MSQDFLVINIVNLLSWINTGIAVLRIRTDGNKVSSSQWLLWPPDTPLTFGAQAAINLDLLFVEHNLLLWCSLHLSKRAETNVLLTSELQDNAGSYHICKPMRRVLQFMQSPRIAINIAPIACRRPLIANDSNNFSCLLHSGWNWK